MPQCQNESVSLLVHPARFELTTSAFGGQRSIQLSYGCIINKVTNTRKHVYLNNKRSGFEIISDVNRSSAIRSFPEGKLAEEL